MQSHSIEEMRKELSKKRRELEKTEKQIAELVHEFVSKIVVHAPYRKDKPRHQQIDVYYDGARIVYTSEAEQIEEMFEEHLEYLKWEREQEVSIKEKTA